MGIGCGLGRLASHARGSENCGALFLLYFCAKVPQKEFCASGRCPDSVACILNVCVEARSARAALCGKYIPGKSLVRPEFSV